MNMTKQISAAGGAALIVLLTIGMTENGLLAQRGTPPPAPAPRPAAPGTTTPRPPATRAASGYNGPRTPDRKPDLNGIWQVLGTAHWNLEAHSALEGVPERSTHCSLV